MRSFDIADFAETAYEVRLTDALDNHNEDHFIKQMKFIEEWGNENCHGKFLILINQVLFTEHRDAVIFKLKYG